MQALRRGEPVQHIDTFRMHKDGTRLEVSSRISPLRDGEGAVIGASKISHDISAKKRNERVLRLFSNAGTVLSALSDEASMLERLARLAVPLFADWCVVSMIDAHGKVQAVGHAHARESMQPVLDEYLARYPLDWNNASITVNVLRSEQAELIADMPAAVLDALATSADHRELLDKLSPRSVLVVPIAIRGKTVGAISFAQSDSLRRYSPEDVGVATGTVRLPLSEAPLDAHAPQITRPLSTQPRRILVVDDNVDTANSVATLLKLAGHEVSLAHDGLAAIEAARKNRPEIVLLDIGLPGLDGYAVARTLREDSELASAKLIAVSGYGQPEDRRRAHEAGFDEHLVKPVAFDKLLSLID